MPRFSAVSITTLGLSTWQVTTSIPWSARLLTASASLTGSTQSPVKITWVVAFGLTVRAPRVKELMLRRDAGYRFAPTKPRLPGCGLFVSSPRVDAVDLLQRGAPLRVALVPAVIVLRPYVGRADDEPRGRGGARDLKAGRDPCGPGRHHLQYGTS